jgi:hypothetical protein
VGLLDGGENVLGPEVERARPAEMRGLGRQIVFGAEMAEELARMGLLDNEKASGRLGASRRSATSLTSIPCARARSIASRAGAVLEPQVMTASGPSPSISAQCWP